MVEKLAQKKQAHRGDEPAEATCLLLQSPSLGKRRRRDHHSLSLAKAGYGARVQQQQHSATSV